MKRILAATFLGALTATPVIAQQTRVERVRDGYIVHTRQNLPDGTSSIAEERIPSVPGLLRDFAARAKNPAAGRSGSSADLTVLAHRELFPLATVDSLLAGYEAFASDPAQDRRVAQRAIVSISMAGSIRERNPVPGQTARLLRIYRAGDTARRFAVVSSLGYASDDRATVAAFLRGVATLPANAETEQLVVAAIRSLALLGEEGPAILRELYRSGAVSDPEGRFVLQAFAQQDSARDDRKACPRAGD
jgi:hypothetical protein